jgi:hypothetical protein
MWNTIVEEPPESACASGPTCAASAAIVISANSNDRGSTDGFFSQLPVDFLPDFSGSTIPVKVCRISQSFFQGLPNRDKLIVFLGYEVLTAVVMNSILRGLFLDPEDGDDMFLRNVG